MVIIMDMHTGKAIREPDGYDDEVLNASWLPRPEPALQLQLVEHPAPERAPRPPLDADGFLRAVYRYQES